MGDIAALRQSPQDLKIGDTAEKIPTRKKREANTSRGVPVVFSSGIEGAGNLRPWKRELEEVQQTTTNTKADMEKDEVPQRCMSLSATQLPASPKLDLRPCWRGGRSGRHFTAASRSLRSPPCLQLASHGFAVGDFCFPGLPQRI